MTDVNAELLERAAAILAKQMRGIVADRVYPPEEAAELIGIDSERKAKTIREIPRELLPDIMVTPGGGKIGYLGSDLLNYVHARRRTA